MKKYAVLSNSIVDNIIVASSLEIAEKATSSFCVLITTETGEAKIGSLYSNGVFSDSEEA